MLLVLVLAPMVLLRVLWFFLPPQEPTFVNSNLFLNLRATGLSVERLLSVTLIKQSQFYVDDLLAEHFSLIFLFMYIKIIPPINISVSTNKKIINATGD